MKIAVCNDDRAAGKHNMKKKLSIGMVCVSLLLGACGNAAEEAEGFL